MSDEPKKNRREELEDKLEANRIARAKGEESQYETDLEARIDLEEKHATIASVTVARYTPGQPTRAYLKTPTGIQYKRYKDQIHRAVASKNVPEQQKAAEQLARACWVYPATDEAKESMLEAFPGLLTTLSIAASALAEGKSEEEKKD